MLARNHLLGAAIAIASALALTSVSASAKPHAAHHAASHRTHPSSGAQRRATLRHATRDVGHRFKAAGHHLRHPSKHRH